MMVLSVSASLASFEQNVSPLTSNDTKLIESINQCLEKTLQSCWSGADNDEATSNTCETILSPSSPTSPSSFPSSIPQHKLIVLSDDEREKAHYQVICEQLQLESKANTMNDTTNISDDLYESLKMYQCELNDILNHTRNLLSQIQKINSLFEYVSFNTNETKDACHHLTSQETVLLQKADTLKYELSFFQEEGRLSHRLAQHQQKNVILSSDEWPSLMTKLENSVDFMHSHPEMRDARKYHYRFLTLRSKALVLIIEMIQSQFKNAANNYTQSRKTLKDSDGLAKTLVEFRSISKHVRPLVSILEHRADTHTQYKETLLQCYQILFDVRYAALYDDAFKYFTQLSRTQSLPQFTRSSSQYLIRFASMDVRVVNEIFNSSSDDTNMMQLSISMCSMFYMHLRPKVIHENDLDQLCDVADIVRVEVLQDQVYPRGEEMISILPVLERTIEDVQERLAYRAQIYVRDEITNFEFSQEQIDYPQILQTAALEGRNVRLWYPTLERTLLSLSNLYRCLQKHVFEYVAQDAVSGCLISLHSAARAIAQTKSQRDAELFLLKHIITLREQIAPLDVDSLIMEKELDFSNFTQSFEGILTGEISPISFLQPRMMYKKKDSKKDIEIELKNVCELLITQTSNDLMAPIVSFLNTVSQHDEDDSPLMNLGGINAVRDLITAALSAISHSFHTEYSSVVANLSLYLNDTQIEQLVLQPIQRNILYGASQMREFIVTRFDNEADTMIDMKPLDDIERIASESSTSSTL